MYKDFEDYKLWCKQNNLKEGNYESLRRYHLNTEITHLSEELVDAFVSVRMKKHNNFTYELLYAIEYMVAATKEEGRKHGPGYPGYMLEKLNNAKRYLDRVIEYYKELEK